MLFHVHQESTQEIPIVGLFFKGHAVSQHLAEAHPYHWSVSEEDRLRIACRAASIGVWQWDLLSNEMQYTTIAREICNRARDLWVPFIRFDHL